MAPVRRVAPLLAVLARGGSLAVVLIAWEL